MLADRIMSKIDSRWPTKTIAGKVGKPSHAR